MLDGVATIETAVPAMVTVIDDMRHAARSPNPSSVRPARPSPAVPVVAHLIGGRFGAMLPLGLLAVTMQELETRLRASRTTYGRDDPQGFTGEGVPARTPVAIGVAVRVGDALLAECRLGALKIPRAGFAAAQVGRGHTLPFGRR